MSVATNSPLNLYTVWWTDQARGAQGKKGEMEPVKLYYITPTGPPHLLFLFHFSFLSLPFHPLLITGTEWAALLPKWLMGSTLCCPLWAGPSRQNYAFWDPRWVVMTGYGSACCPCCFQGHLIQVREKNWALRRGAAVHHLLRGTGLKHKGGAIYYLP